MTNTVQNSSENLRAFMIRFNEALLSVEPHSLKEKLAYLYSNSKHEGLRALISEGRVKSEHMLDDAVEGFITGEEYRKHYPTRTEERNNIRMRRLRTSSNKPPVMRRKITTITRDWRL